MISIFDNLAFTTSKNCTQRYSTSFSLGIKFLSKSLHDPIYAIYGFVRFADEIVDTFEGFNKKELLQKFKTDTFEAIKDGISLNPILHAFQKIVNEYHIDETLIHTFLNSMEMDLEKQYYTTDKYNQYILGSAEVVGLMCLKVFTNKDQKLYEALKPFAMNLGAAFQKVNFLRDIKADYQQLGRSYFPDVELENFTKSNKIEIENNIQQDFTKALEGIKMLPKSSRAGVYLAYIYYKALFQKIKNVPAERILKERIRINDSQKFTLMINSLIKVKCNVL